MQTKRMNAKMVMKEPNRIFEFQIVIDQTRNDALISGILFVFQCVSSSLSSGRFPPKNSKETFLGTTDTKNNFYLTNICFECTLESRWQNE